MIIPGSVMIEQEIFASNISRGSQSFGIRSPLYEGDHWCLSYWNKIPDELAQGRDYGTVSMGKWKKLSKRVYRVVLSQVLLSPDDDKFRAPLSRIKTTYDVTFDYSYSSFVVNSATVQYYDPLTEPAFSTLETLLLWTLTS